MQLTALPAAPHAAGCSVAALLRWAALTDLATSAAAPLLLLLLQVVCRTIVCTAYLPSPGLEPAPTPLALANQHYPAKQDLFPGSKPSQDSLAAS